MPSFAPSLYMGSVIAYYMLLIGAMCFIFLLFSTTLVNLMVRVPFVPTSKRVINYIIKIANLKKGEKVYDLGCGDGRFLFEAEKITQTTANGFEMAPIPYFMAKIRQYINKAKVKISMADFYAINLNDADVIYCYLAPEAMTKLSDKFKKECKKGTRIYSHTFPIHQFEPTKVWSKDKQKRLPSIYLYQI